MVLILSATISTGKYEEAVTIPKKDQEAVDVVAASIFISVLSSIFFAIFFFFFYKKIVRHSTEFDFWIYVVLLPIGILGINIVNILTHWAIRKKDFGIQSKVRVAQSSAKAIFELTGGFFKMGSIILVIGTVIGMAGGMITFSRYYLSNLRKNALEFRASFSKERLQAVFQRFINFPKFFVLMGIINKVINHLPIFFLTAYSTIEMIGHYSIAVLAVSIPNSIVMSSILNIFYANISSKLIEEKDDVVSFFRQGVIFSSLICLVIGLGFFLLGKPFLYLAFGSQWQAAGEILTHYGWIILAMTWYFMALYVFKLLEKQRELLIYNFFKLLILGGAFLFCFQKGWDEKTTIWVFVLLFTLTTGLQLFASYRYLLSRKK